MTNLNVFFLHIIQLIDEYTNLKVSMHCNLVEQYLLGMTEGSGSMDYVSVLWSKIGPGIDLLWITWSSTMLLASE